MFQQEKRFFDNFPTARSFGGGAAVTAIIWWNVSCVCAGILFVQ